MTVSDFYFLGRGSDYFVGSIESTFSQLIADLVASSNALRGVNFRCAGAWGSKEGGGLSGAGSRGEGAGTGSGSGSGRVWGANNFSGESIRGSYLDGIYWVPPQWQGKYYNNLVNANNCTA